MLVSDPVESGGGEYAISCSPRVRERLIELSRVSHERGDGAAFLAALVQFEARLRVYPQFGDPLADLGSVGGAIRIGVIRPLSMRYAVVEERRLVLPGALPVLMPPERSEG